MIVSCSGGRGGGGRGGGAGNHKGGGPEPWSAPGMKGEQIDGRRY